MNGITNPEVHDPVTSLKNAMINRIIGKQVIEEKLRSLKDLTPLEIELEIATLQKELTIKSIRADIVQQLPAQDKLEYYLSKGNDLSTLLALSSANSPEERKPIDYKSIIAKHTKELIQENNKSDIE